MFDTTQTTSIDGHSAVPFHLLEDVDDFESLLEDVQKGENTLKRLRSEGECALESFLDEPLETSTHQKKLKMTENDDVMRLMNTEFKDDDFTHRFEQECPSLMGSCDLECDLDMDVSTLFLEEDDPDFVQGRMHTPPPVLSRSSSLVTPPHSPRASDCAPELSLSRGTSVLSMLSSRSLSVISVLSDDILDLDTIPVTLEEPPPTPVRPVLFKLTRKVEVEEGAIPMPSDSWFANYSSPPSGSAGTKKEMPRIKARRVYVEEEVLSTEQRRKHRQWVNRRKKCLTGYSGYKCPAKSRAAKRKVRNNGRFDLKKSSSK